MPSNGTQRDPLSNDDAVRQATAALSPDEGTPETSTGPEGTDGTASGSPKARVYQDILKGLSPADREVMENTLKGLQSSKDKVITKYRDVDDATLQAVKSIQADPKLQTAVQQAIADYQTGSLSSKEAKAAIVEAAQDSFDAMVNDPNLSGQDRAVLMKFRTAITKEAQGVLQPYDARLRTVESLLLKSKLEERSGTLSGLKEQMGEDTYDKYWPEASRLIEAGLDPKRAFKAVMEDTDVATWLKPKSPKTVSAKKSASEVMHATHPAAEEGLLKEGASPKEQKEISRKGISRAISTIFGG